MREERGGGRGEKVRDKEGKGGRGKEKGNDRRKEGQENEEREEGRSGSRRDRVGSQSTVTNGCIPF